MKRQDWRVIQYGIIILKFHFGFECTHSYRAFLILLQNRLQSTLSVPRLLWGEAERRYWSNVIFCEQKLFLRVKKGSKRRGFRKHI